MTSTCLSTTWPDNSLQTVGREVEGGRRGIEKEGVRERKGAGTIREREGSSSSSQGTVPSSARCNGHFSCTKHTWTHTHSHTQSNTITHTHTNYVRDYAKSESQSESESECEHVRSLCDHFAMRTSCQATDCKQQQQQQHTSKHSSSSAGECVRRGVAGEGGNVLRLHVHLNAAWFDYKAAKFSSWHQQLFVAWSALSL